MTRYFQVPEGRTLVMPQGVQIGPGASSMRYKAGGILVLEDAEVLTNQRFLSGRVRAGDLVELEAAVGEAAAKKQAAELEQAEKARQAAKADANAETPTEAKIEALPKPDPTKPMLKPTAGHPLGGGVIANPAKGEG